MPVPHAPVLTQVLNEADDIAHATDQRLTTGHVLLAFFTVPNGAGHLLAERGIDEDRLLDAVEGKLAEPPDTLPQVIERAGQIAAGCGARAVDCLHILVAMTRAKGSAGLALLEAVGEPISLLRTKALAVLTGAMPKWVGEEEEPAQSHIRRAPLERPALRPTPKGPQFPGMSAAIKWNPRGRAPSKPVRSLLPAQGARIDRTLEPREVPASDAAIRPAQKQPPPPSKPPPPPSKPPPAPSSKKPPAEKQLDPAAPWLLRADEYPWLTSLGRNLSAEAARGHLDRLIGRDSEIDELIDILGKRRANNPCLLGEPGVGKTAVVEGLALALVHHPRGPDMARRVIVELDVGSLLLGTHLRGSFSEKLQGIKEEVKKSKGRVIVFFDELHTLVGAGSTGDGAQDASNELKAALSRGEFPCIGATTHDEWKKHVEPDSALKRRFTPVVIKEPAPDEAKRMLERIAPTYEEHHRVRIEKSAVDAAVDLSVRFLTDRYLPDKAIALLDLAGSRAARSGTPVVTRESIAQIVATRVDIPLERVLASDRERLLALESELSREIVGHRRQLARIADVIRRNAAGFSSKRPKGSFLFLGPTGVGKTETAKALARLLHGSEEAMLRFDLSEFSEAHSVARLVGSPPGYVGHEAGGQLTEAVRKRPACVLLLDEIEKAHHDVLQVLLQVLDEGRLTDGHGRTVTFYETIIVMTSNLGADLARAGKRIGFDQAIEGSPSGYDEAVLAEAKRSMAPELWGRIEERLVFAPLSIDEVRAVARLLAEGSSRRLGRERGIEFRLDDRAVDFIVREGGFDLRLGARPMRSLLARIVEAPIASRILEGRLHAGEQVQVTTNDEGMLRFLVGEDRTSLSQRPTR